MLKWSVGLCGRVFVALMMVAQLCVLMLFFGPTNPERFFTDEVMTHMTTVSEKMLASDLQKLTKDDLLAGEFAELQIAPDILSKLHCVRKNEACVEWWFYTPMYREWVYYVYCPVTEDVAKMQDVCWNAKIVPLSEEWHAVFR